jgi:hypothetical protein
LFDFQELRKIRAQKPTFCTFNKNVYFLLSAMQIYKEGVTSHAAYRRYDINLYEEKVGKLLPRITEVSQSPGTHKSRALE